MRATIDPGQAAVIGNACVLFRRLGRLDMHFPQAGLPSLRFRLKPMGFKHTGLFPEQAVNWERMAALIRKSGRPTKVLNLFGYTAAQLWPALRRERSDPCGCLQGNGFLGKENAIWSGLEERPIRWLVDDCGKFGRPGTAAGQHL